MQSAANVCSIAAPSLHVSQGDFLADLGLQEIFQKQMKNKMLLLDLFRLSDSVLGQGLVNLKK